MTTAADLDAPGSNPFAVAAAAAAQLRARTGVERHDVALVLGSGWAPAADLLGETVADVPAADLAGFTPPAVPGHLGTIRSVRLADGRHALLLGARTHLYEGRGVRAVVHGVRTAAAAGARLVVLTNGAGGIEPSWSPGTPVLISDHLNLTGASPLEGPTFVDLTDLYSARLRALARSVDPRLPEGVYVQFRGPQYETPAEVRMLRQLGADAVGMSTVLETIQARALGLEVAGFSCLTNWAAGISGEHVSHEAVLATGKAAAADFSRLLAAALAVE